MNLTFDLQNLIRASAEASEYPVIFILSFINIVQAVHDISDEMNEQMEGRTGQPKT